MKKQKVLVPFLFILVFFIVFLGCSVLWKDGWWHSKAEDEDTTTTSTDIGVLDPNKSGQTLISVDTTFYNYRYDNELSANNATRNQGKESCYDGGVIPFGEFDSALSEYYKENGVNVGIYTGNFYNYYGGLPGVGANKKTFPGYYNFKWAANIANRTSPYDSVCQGIVENKLEDFDISKNNFGTLMTATTKSDGTTGKVKVPYFDKGFLTENNKVNGVAIGAVKEGVKFPFRKITSGSKSGYYEFDSTKDVIKFDGMETGKPSSDTYYYGKEGKLQYYYNKENVTCKSSSSAQFFPFNKKTDGQSNIDYGFGVRFDIPFFLSEDGKLNGKNMVFEFSGDDDVWIFLDGKLIMDLGGQHGKSTGTIDFGATKTVDGETIGGAIATVSSVTRVKASTLATETAMSDAILAEDTYIQHNVQSDFVSVKKGDTEKHVITIFYMERGMFESNFHMAFNFVPEGQPMPTPMPTANPNDVDIKGGTLKIQNKMVFPTTTPDAKDSTESKINKKFLQTVKDLAEDDVFRYSVQNQGTKATHVLGNEFSYPSGKLTVRRNDNTTKKENSYLSFSERENVVRVYFDIGAAEALIANLGGGYSGYKFTIDSNTKQIKLADIDIKGGTKQSIGLVPYEESYDSTTGKYKYYYMDIKVNTLGSGETPYFRIRFGESQVKTSNNGDQFVKLHIPKVNVTSIRDLDGALFIPLAINTKQGSADTLVVTSKTPSEITSNNIIYDNKNISLTEGKDYKWEDANTNSDKHPKYSGGEDSSSVGLPYQDAGTENANKFTPDSASSGFLDVSNTAFELTEAYLAPTTDPNSSETRKILKNSDSTTGITDSNGCFALFYDDSATFKKQFSTESQMKVVQKEDLLKPSRYPETSLSETVPAATALTTFTPYESGKERKTANYYYTTVKAESTGISNDDANVTTTAAISVSSDGRYNYSNASAISTNSDVDITQTFTNTVKYGSLTISKELKGHMDADTNYSYGFEVTFSNVFGGTSTEAKYTGDYILVETDGTQTPKNITDDGDIILQPNQKAIITGIPVGTTYKVEELGAYVGDNFEDDGSVVSKIQTSYVAQVEDATITSPVYDATDEQKEGKTVSGVIPCSVVNKAYLTETNEFSEVNVTVAFTNQFGALTITKKLAGDVNNANYYNTNNASNYEKKYTFTVKNGTTPYNGKYWVYTYKFVAANLPLVVDKKEEKETTDGTIILKEGQEAEIGGIKLTDKLKYTITEEIGETDIYFVESLKVTSGTTDSTATTSDTISGPNDNTNYNTSITSGEFSSSQPTFDVIFTNRYSNAYIKIDKFIDKLYCGDKKYADYTDDSGKTDITYQELTGAKQSFIFKVKQYKTLEAAKKDEDSEGSFNVVLNIGSGLSSENLTTEGANILGASTAYKDSKTVKVLANRYYRIEEDTDWSWKYIFKGVSQQDTNKGSSTYEVKDTSGNVTNKVVILKTYLDALNNIDDGDGKRKVVPIAEFYNALDTTKEDIEGDTDSIPNKIKTE